MDEEHIARKMLAEEIRRELFDLINLVSKPLQQGQHPLLKLEILKSIEMNVRAIATDFALKLVRRAGGEPDPEPEQWDPKTHNVANIVIIGILESQTETKLNGIYRRLIDTAVKKQGGKSDEVKLEVAKRFYCGVGDAFSVLFA